MTEALFTLVGLAAAVPFAVAWWGERQLSRICERSLEGEREYSAKLQSLLMARTAPAEYAAYIEPQSLAEDFPEDAVWDESGLYYVAASDGGL